MWMMGCRNNGSHEVHKSHDSSLNGGRRLKPLMPRPTTTTCASPTNAAMSFALSTHHHHPYISNCTLHASSDELLAFNHRLAERYKKDFEEQQQLLASTASRWNPTPEQLQALEDIYRHGTRTPSSEQIQQIAIQLRRFGKIEGKNVFYWFQNHKARERQKRRRVSESAFVMEQQGHVGSLEKPDSGLRRTSFEVEQTKNWTPPSNCSIHSEEPVSIHRAAVVAESRSADGWIQFEERELLQRRNTVEKLATCQMMELSCSPTTQYIINTITTAATATEALTTTIEKILPTNRDIITTNYHEEHESIADQSQTLELFPLRSDDCHGVNYAREEDHVITNFSTPMQFIEFLPLKN